MDRRRRLAELLLSTFRLDGELRRFFAAVGTDGFSATLPSPPVSDATLAHEGVAAMESWGLVDAPMWAALREQRPRRRAEIDEVARSWTGEPVEGTAWLTFGEVAQLANLVLGAPFRADRDALFASIPTAVRESIPRAPTAVGQVLADLDALNRASDQGQTCWLERWIDNARALCAGDTQRAAGLDFFLACVRSRRPLEDGLAWAIIGRSPNPLLRGWPRFSRPLRYTLAMASHLHLEAATRDPRERDFMATRHFFAALRLLEPAPVGAVLSRIPPEALEELPAVAPGLNPAFLVETPQASACLRGAIGRLLDRVPPGREITAGDLFLDVAKYGNGDSVERLRRNGVLAADLDDIAVEIGFHPLTTPGPKVGRPAVGP